MNQSLIVVLLAVCACTFPVTGETIFEDTFDHFDTDVWEHEITARGGGNGEFQYYLNNRTNSYVKNNILYIKPTLTSDTEGEEFLTSGTLNLWGSTPADLCTGHDSLGCEKTGSYNDIINPIQSASIRTVNSYSFKYGSVEVIAQMPKGDWIWPVIGLLPKSNAYGKFPASGGVDIVQSRGNVNLMDSSGVQVGAEQVGVAMHWGPYLALDKYATTQAVKNLASGNFGDSFHNYTIEWTDHDMCFYVDGEEILHVDPHDGFWAYGQFDTTNPGMSNPWANSNVTMAPFDKEFYIFMNVAVGGTNGYFADSDTNSGYSKPWENSSGQAAKDFYDAKSSWYPTWNPNTNNGEDAALKIKSVRVFDDVTGHDNHDHEH